MRPLFIALLLIFSWHADAQQRETISGKINPPEGESAQGISILNISALEATVSDRDGLFEIPAAVGDTLQFKSLQFQDFSVVVDQGVMDTGSLNVFISEAVTELPEVVVTPYDLTGNVRVDVAIIPVQPAPLPTQTAAEINPYEWDFRPDSLSSPPNAAMRDAMIYSGGNLASIFRNIFTPRNVLTEVGKEEELDEQIRLLYDDDFFEKHLNIKEENIHEFIYFAQDNGLIADMLQEEQEMELIEFLVEQSFRFRARMADRE